MHKKGVVILFAYVTNDKYELPLYVGEIHEVTRKFGVSCGIVYHDARAYDKGKLCKKKYRFIKFKMPEDEWREAITGEKKNVKESRNG
jgi:hypothetical protein